MIGNLTLDTEIIIFQFPLLSLPNDILVMLYPHIDLASRRALRVNRILRDIETEVTYRYGLLRIHVVSSSTYIFSLVPRAYITFDEYCIYKTLILSDLLID